LEKIQSQLAGGCFVQKDKTISASEQKCGGQRKFSDALLVKARLWTASRARSWRASPAVFPLVFGNPSKIRRKQGRTLQPT
jgi:hypothetical protein